MSLSLSAAKLCKRSAPDGLHHLDYRVNFRPDTISHYSMLQVSRCELLNQTSIWDCQENMAESHLENITTDTVNLETSQSRGDSRATNVPANQPQNYQEQYGSYQKSRDAKKISN